jgi:hypothetical protein
MPKHKWKGTKLSFEKPDGTFGKSVDLKGNGGVIIQRTGGGGGSSATKLLDPVFTYTAGLLTSILYEGGHTKTMTYNVDDTLSQLVSVIDSITTTKTFTWNVDGTLAYITQT